MTELEIKATEWMKSLWSEKAYANILKHNGLASIVESYEQHLKMLACCEEIKRDYANKPRGKFPQRESDIWSHDNFALYTA